MAGAACLIRDAQIAWIYEADELGRLVSPGFGFPPWQSVQPSTTFGDACMEMASVLVWHSMQPALFARASA
jgi:hypothetical protein